MPEYCMSKSLNLRPERARGVFTFALIKVRDNRDKSYDCWFLKIETKEQLESYMKAFGIYLAQQYFRGKEAQLDNRHFENELQTYIARYLSTVKTERGTSFDDLQLINQKFLSFVKPFIQGKNIIVNKNYGWRFLEQNMIILKEETKDIFEFPKNGKDMKIKETKLYDIDNPDDIEKSNGFIDKEGNWYSVEHIKHNDFARDYLTKHKLDGTEITSKDCIIKDYGWIGVTRGAVGEYVIGGKYNKKQRKTLKKWFIKHSIRSFCPQGDNDFMYNISDKNNSWFDEGRE